MKSKSIKETKKLIREATAQMARQILQKKAEDSTRNEQRWKRGIEGDIKWLRKEVNFLKREVKGELGLKKKTKIE